MIILNTATHKIEIPALPSDNELAKDWRDSELSVTDWIVPVTDHPQHAAYLVYRQALRDWPESGSFPATKPVI